MRIAELYSWTKRFLTKVDYYFCPPLLHDAVVYCMPRCFQPDISKQLLRALKRRLGARFSPGDDCAGFSTRYWDACLAPEENVQFVRAKSERLRELLRSYRVGRVRVLRDLARLEWMNENKFVAALYRLRAMRLLGSDVYGDLTTVVPTLHSAGYVAEAESAIAMFTPRADSDAACEGLLHRALERGKQTVPSCEFEVFDDRRGTEPPAVSVIVSLYNAASKLPTFLKALQSQTLNRAGRMELILVDSGSPADEYRALRDVDLSYPIPHVFVRTVRRETIQTAWNRGLALARAPYLTCLGVDETIRPEALQILSGHLDADSQLDWVQANSLVTDVDAHGSFVRDVMMYDRRNSTPDHLYLDTCYLNWVGGLYRRSVHDRCGYYDGTFGAAGDTEFKLCVKPFIRTKCIPDMLGLFLNYPEDRTTASPRAELEDLRAWYLHRTAGGVRYAMQGRESADLEQLLVLSLGYRKSYLKSTSTDLELADNVSRVLRERAPASPLLKLTDGVARLLRAVRALDHMPQVGVDDVATAARKSHAAAAEVEAAHRSTPWLPRAAYSVYNDNRYEQHVSVW